MLIGLSSSRRWTHFVLSKYELFFSFFSFFFYFPFFRGKNLFRLKWRARFAFCRIIKGCPRSSPSLLRLSTPSCSNTPRFYPLTALFESNPLHHPLIHTPATRFDPLFFFISFLPPDFLFNFYFFSFLFFLVSLFLFLLLLFFFFF